MSTQQARNWVCGISLKEDTTKQKIAHQIVNNDTSCLQSTQCVCEQVHQLNKQHESSINKNLMCKNEPQNTFPTLLHDL